MSRSKGRSSCDFCNALATLWVDPGGRGEVASCSGCAGISVIERPATDAEMRQWGCRMVREHVYVHENDKMLDGWI